MGPERVDRHWYSSGEVGPETLGGLTRAALAALQLAAAVWTYQDAAGWCRRAWWWGLAVAAAGPVAFPAYVLLVRPPKNPWGAAEALAVAAFGLVAVPVAVSLVTGPWLDLRAVAAVVVAQSVALLAGCWQVLRRAGVSWAQLGLAGPRALRCAGTGFLVGLPLVAVVHYAVQPAAVYLLGLVVGHDRARALAELEQWGNPLVQAMPPLENWPAVVGFAVLVCGLVPLAEEAFFRGVVYGAAQPALGPRWAPAFTGLVFAAVHLQVTNFLPIAVLGWVFAVSVQRTGSLLPAVVMHGMNNLVALAVAYGQR